MARYIVMQRQGAFKPAEATEYQCKERGHSLYHYDVKLIWSGNVRLDERDFILDHKEVDAVVQAVPLARSCELMQDGVVFALREHMRKHNIDIVACRVWIEPDGWPDGDARMAGIWIDRDHYHLAGLLR